MISNNQVIYMIYNYLFLEESRLDNIRFERSKFITPHNITYDRAYKFIEADLKYKHFREFMIKVMEILRYYDDHS